MADKGTRNPTATLVWEPEEWSQGERLQLLRLLFGPRQAPSHREHDVAEPEGVVPSKTHD